MSNSSPSRADTLVTGALVVSALCLSITVAYRTFGPRTASSKVDERPTKIEQWQEVVSVGRTISGDSASSTTLAVFSDFQCPACRGFHEAVLTSAMKKHGQSLRVVYVHHPLEYHSQALPSARAMECISDSSIARRFVDVLLSQQDSLGKKAFSVFALEAGLQDTLPFHHCLTRTDEVASISKGLELGSLLGVKGTPSVAIDGWMLPVPPRATAIDSIVELAVRKRHDR
jgi:protein-disulfide isomerase